MCGWLTLKPMSDMIILPPRGIAWVALKGLSKGFSFTILSNGDPPKRHIWRRSVVG